MSDDLPTVVVLGDDVAQARRINEVTGSLVVVDRGDAVAEGIILVGNGVGRRRYRDEAALRVVSVGRGDTVIDLGDQIAGGAVAVLSRANRRVLDERVSRVFGCH